MNMRVKADKLYTVLFFYLLALHFAIFSESSDITLSIYNSNWNCIFGGETISAPKQTSGGFMLLTDGKMLTSCSESGNILWEKKLKGNSPPLFSVLPDDFVAVVSDKSNLSLLNRGGATVWTKRVDFKIRHEPQQGRDGRIFIAGEKNIACFGTNGICKWNLKTKTIKDIPIQALNDGSLLVILENNKNEGSNETPGALIISPFGKIMQILDLPGEVACALSCENGVLIAFQTGEFSLYSVVDGNTKQVWSAPLEKKGLQGENLRNDRVIFPLKNNLSALLLQENSLSSTVVIFENSTGAIQTTFKSTVQTKELTCYSRAKSGDALFLCDKKSALVYDFSGKIIWSARLPSLENRKTAWNYIAYTKNDLLLLCSKSWMVSAYRTIQAQKKDMDKKHIKNPCYENFYRDISELYSGILSESLSFEATDHGRETILAHGFYAEKEADYASTVFSALNAYKNMLSTKNSRDTQKSRLLYDKDGFTSLLNQGCLLGGKKMSELLSEIASYQNDSDTLLLLTEAMGKARYDPNGKMISVLEAILLNMPAIHSKNIIAASDAIFEICQFMGSREFYSKSIKTLSSLISTKYDNSVRENARKNLSNLKAR